jgi:hypothetical protein
MLGDMSDRAWDLYHESDNLSREDRLKLAEWFAHTAGFLLIINDETGRVIGHRYADETRTEPRRLPGTAVKDDTAAAV